MAATNAGLTAQVGGVRSDLATNYLTTADTNTAIAAAKTTLSASLIPFQTQKMHADFRFGDYYWAASYTQSVAALPAAAYPSVAYGDVTLPVVAGIGAVLEAGPSAANRTFSERTHRPFVVGQKMRFRMKTRLTANPTTGSHATRFYMAYTDSAGAYLNITAAVAVFTGTVVADGWVIKEFVFDPQAIKAAGAYAATAVNWRLAVQVSGLNSATQQVEWVEVEDVTFEKSTDSLFADITDIKAVSVSALTGTALGTLLSQLGVAAGGTSAWVTDQTSAVATLEGYAAASYVLRVGAGGASAGMEIVAADDPVLGPASTITLSAKHIEILASSIRISDSSNIYPDFDMKDPLFYSSVKAPTNGAVFQFIPTSATNLGAQFLEIAANAAAKSVETGWFAVEPFTEYLVSGIAFLYTSTAGSGTASLLFETGSLAANGTVTGLTSQVVSAKTDASYVGGVISVETVATAKRARFVMLRSAGGTSAGGFGNLKVQKKSNATLIGDGSISTKHVDTEGLSADVITTGIMNARLLEVTELLRIASGTGALSVGKDSAFDLVNDGIFFGRTLGDGGVYGFGLLAGKKTASGKDQYIQATDQTGLKMVNASHFVTGNTLPTVVTKTVTTAKTNLPVGTKTIWIDLMGGGAEGWGVSTSGNSFVYQTGNAGANTVVKLYDGATLMGTYTATGGANTGNGGVHAGQASSLAAGGAGGTSGAGTAGTLGSGGGGGYAEYSVSGPEHGGGNVAFYKSAARGGKAGQFVTLAAIDLSSYAAPAIEITIGAGGDGAGNGGKGGNGRVKYAHSMAAELRADVVPLAPTATGTFSKPNGGANVSFPALGAGFWICSTGAAFTATNMDEIYPANGATIYAGSATTFSFFSDQTPTYKPGATARTIYYTFYSMGNWGS